MLQIANTTNHRVEIMRNDCSTASSENVDTMGNVSLMPVRAGVGEADARWNANTRVQLAILMVGI